MSDPINPAHYKSLKPEPIDVIEAWGLGFNLGNAVKYLARAGRKDPSKTIEDLRKARWYLDREIRRLELAGSPPREDLLEYLQEQWKKLESEPPVEPTP